MDAPSSNSINPSVPRQRSSPANDHSLAPSPMPQQQPYPYPVQQQQQQQPAWSPSPQQFYPQFYQNPHQQPYPIHAHPGHPQQGQMPYYDPANAQFAQWAYQQMLLNQAHQMSQMSQPGSQRSRSGGNPSPEYFGQSPMAGFSPFPSGTPPPHPSQLPMGYSPGPPSEQGSQYGGGGYHPYRRPQRHGSQNQDTDWRQGPQHAGPFKPPYAHADAAGSSTSVNSGSSQSGSQRQRTNSTQGSAPGTINPAPGHSHTKSSSSNGHGRTAPSASTPPAPSNVPAPPRIHQRTGSSSSSTSSRPAASTLPPTSSPTAPQSTVNLRKPSPLSQGTFTAAEKRMSRDDSDLAAMLEPAAGVRSAGLKGRLRRALSLNANNALREEEEEDATTRGHPPRPSQSSVGSSATLAMDDSDSTATVQKKKSRSLFNSKLNRSTDNISLSSTMSSASMVIRKLGSIGKLARRNSLAGITSLFKDKKEKEDEEGVAGKKSKKKKGEKAPAADPSVSHATVELDRSDWSASPEMAGLSPAARLARQHTLKTNAEAAARAKAEAEARAAAAAAASATQGPVPTTWEKNTTTRQGDASPAKPGSSSRVGENGTRVVIEHDDSDSEDGHSDLGHPNHSQNYSIEGWEDDEDWNEAHEEEDVTIRQSLDNASLEDEEMEPWAINVRRSIERTLKPAKGILKRGPDGTEYTQDAYLPPNPAFTRMRSNSYDSAQPSSELPPLGHLPASDPAQIDGLHKQHGSANGHSPQNSGAFLPPLSFDSNGLAVESPKHEAPANVAVTIMEKSPLFNHPNSSAPALSLHSSNPPTLTHRSQTAPAKRLAFAANLSVYDTFPATVYDRRSEPATWSRLTPALAQRIKEELNSYKMEEMEVHAASRVHTQFFV
ncbi:hypothetical protein BC628DRAFT_1419311 [Trametes gibbosa]|nr:hypothetical protein BC628DRAFT_1419311 [Trametes gibbosa]